MALFEQNKFNPSVDTVISTSEQFGVKTDWLLRGDFMGWAHNAKIAPYEYDFLLTLWNVIHDESKRISDEVGAEVGINEVASIFSKDLTLMFNSRLTPEEDDLLRKYRLVTPQDKKEIQALLDLKCSTIQAKTLITRNYTPNDLNSLGPNKTSAEYVSNKKTLIYHNVINLREARGRSRCRSC